MDLFLTKRFQAGIEITGDQIKSAVVCREGKNFFIKELSDIELIPQVVQPSFKKENIIDAHAFNRALKKCCEEISVKKVGVSLPDICVKVMIKNYPELPDNTRETEEMIQWDISSSLNVPADDLRVSWTKMGKSVEGSHVFLVALGMKTILRQYEEAFKQVGVKPVLMSPAGLNQFNFYSPRLPETGCASYLGMFDDFVNIFVFLNGIPVFYRTVKKGLLGDQDASAINDVDLLIQYYNTEHPDLSIDQFFVASHIKSEAQIAQVLNEIGDIGFEVIEERDLIGFDENFVIHPENKPLPFYTSVLGAAQGI